MRPRSVVKCRPCLEQFDVKQLLSTGVLTTHVANTQSGSRAATLHLADTSNVHATAANLAVNQERTQAQNARRQPAPPGAFGFLAFRVTNTPWQTPYKLIPPFQQVLVQGGQPVPGQTYNVAFVTVKNGTAQTFTASNRFHGEVDEPTTILGGAFLSSYRRNQQ